MFNSDVQNMKTVGLFVGYFLLSTAIACSNVRDAISPPWKELTSLQWRWAMDSKDIYTDVLRCSRVTFDFDESKGDFTLKIQYGPLAHQIYSFTGKHENGNKYLLPTSFSRSWKNIMSYNYPFNPEFFWEYNSEEQVTAHVIADRRKHALIVILCLPGTGGEAVWAFTRHRRTTPTVQNVIKRELAKARVETDVRLSSCPRSGRKS